MKYDFSGYVTKHNVMCSDGRTISKEAFRESDKARVPLVYQHNHNDVSQVLGYVDLEHRDEGVYGYGSFNGTASAQNAREQVKHGDITSMSIYANHIRQNGTMVVHGEIKEVSLVLSGANPGARIDNLAVVHDDFEETIDDEVIVYSGESFDLEDGSPKSDTVEHADDSVLDVFNTLNNTQKNAVYFMLVALANALGEDEDEDEVSQSDEGDDEMSYNIFEGESKSKETSVLTHDQIGQIFKDAKKMGSLKDSVLAHADDYGITNIEMLFPDAKLVNGVSPEWIKRKTEWVDGVLNGCRHSPFSRIKMMYADITLDTARAKGYVKGNMKKEEFFSLSKREVGPCTIYKKQKLDHDDIIDITSFDVVSWIKGEMRMMLDEEIARAILIGDGREVDDEDKINNKCLIPIVEEAELYVTKVTLPASATPDEEIDAMIKAMDDFEGTGTPNMYLPRQRLIDYKLIKDKNGRRIYSSDAEIANLIGVGRMVEVPVMKGVKVDGKELVGIIVNLADYTIGADKGGQISFFDDFDIDYNQYKYLYETRISGCLTKMKSAVVVLRATA